MSAAKRVERRSDGRVFDSVVEAADEYGRTSPNISRAARETGKGLYVTAYGEQWRYWKPQNTQAWPEETDNPIKRKQSARAAKKRARATLAAQIDKIKCPAGFTGECHNLELCRQLVGFLFDGIDLEALKNERQD